MKAIMSRFVNLEFGDESADQSRQMKGAGKLVGRIISTKHDAF